MEEKMSVQSGLEPQFFKSALLFDGMADYVDCGGIADPDDEPWTIELWFRCDRIHGENTLYQKGPLYEASIINGYLQYSWRPDVDWQAETNFPVDVSEWYHAAMVYDGNRQYLYRNGVLVYANTQIGDLGTNTAHLLFATRNQMQPECFFQGAMDEIRMWNVDRSGTQIQAQMRQRLTGDEPNLICYWHFEDGKARDYAKNGDFGQLGVIHGHPQTIHSPIPSNQ